MKTLLVAIWICSAILPRGFAERWEATTRECSLEFPDGSWAFRAGGPIANGQMIVSASNQEHTKFVSVIKYQVPASFTVKNPHFLQGLKDAFARTGAQFLSDGYTNVNGCVVYWYTGVAPVNGKEISTLRYALSGGGNLYQVMAESAVGSPLADQELLGILTSFHMSARDSSSSGTASSADSMAYNIGRITGCLLVIIAVAAVIVKSARKPLSGRSGSP